MSQTKLIQELAGLHQKRPVWKKRGVLLSCWLIFNFLYFFIISYLFSDLILRSSIFTFGISLLVSLLGWMLFSKLLNGEDSNSKLESLGFFTLVILIAATFFYDEFIAQNILHQRHLSFSSGDLSCFSHSLLASFAPLLLGSILIKYFFVGKKIWAISFLTLHVSVMAFLWIEMSCYDREMWHLLLGHESPVVGIFITLLGLSYLLKRRSSSAA